MRRRYLCFPVLALLLMLAATAFAAASLRDFNAAAETVASHNRVALGYLRTGNIDLARLESDRLRDAWSALAARFKNDRPDAFDASLYTATLDGVTAEVGALTVQLNAGKTEDAQITLMRIRDGLSDLRRKSGVPVLGDCILDSAAKMKALADFDKPPVEWAAADGPIGTAAKSYGAALAQCDAMAPADVKASDEFRRLIDGAQASLALVPKAVAERDADLFHRIVIELRSFDNLLAFRFG